MLIKVGIVPTSPKLCRSIDVTLAYVAAVEPHVTPWKEHQLGWVVKRLLDNSNEVSFAAASIMDASTIAVSCSFL